MLTRARVQVHCRVRPLKAEQKMTLCLESDRSITVKGRPFAFDRIHGPSACQADVFSEVAPLVQAVTSGYNCCIFAYGQTGSGKTFTLEGDEVNPGVSKRAVRMIFDQIHEARCSGATVEMSLLEIYNESIKDLLRPDSGRGQAPSLAITQGAGGNATTEVAGLTKVTVTTAEQTLRELEVATRRRTRRATSMNANSSRSHLVLTVSVTLEVALEGSTTTTCGSLMICDLAGSERLSRTHAACGSMELTEANAINKSLLALRNVVHKLAADEPAGHVPFRESKLTHLLKGRLGQEGSKALMLVCASPLEADADETLTSLNFGQEVQCVKCSGTDRRRVRTSDNKTLCELAAERQRNTSLQSQLEKQAAVLELTQKESAHVTAALQAAVAEKKDLEARLERAEKRARVMEQQSQEKQARLERLEREKETEKQRNSQGTPVARVRGMDSHIERLKKSTGIPSGGGSGKKRKMKTLSENGFTPRTPRALGTPRQCQ